MAGKMFGMRRKATGGGRDASRTNAAQPAVRGRVLELSQQARGLVDSRQFAGAIPVFQEAIDNIRRSPDAHLRQYQGMLGVCLCMQAKCQRQTGSTREALAAAEESAAIFTAISGSDSLLLCSLEIAAQSLNALSERPKDKAIAATRAAHLLAHTSDSEPDRLGRQMRMLNLAANARNDCDEIPEALQLRKEVIDVVGLIVERTPDQRHRLAIDYSSLAVLHAKLGEMPEAGAAADTCGAAMADPEFTVSAADRFVVARNLSALARRLADHSHRSEARPRYVAAIEAFRALGPTITEPVKASFALALNNHAWNLCALGEQQEALPFVEEAIDLLRSISELGPAERAHLSGSLDTLATALALSGRTDKALAACTEALEIRRELAEADPDKHTSRIPSMETLLARTEGRESGSLIDR